MPGLGQNPASFATTVTAAYDALNRLTTLNDAMGTSTFTYANFGAFAGALATEDGPWASDTVTHNYTNRLQQTLTVAQPTGSWAQNYGYDGLQRLHTFNSSSGTFAYAYNGAGSQINTLTLPGSGNSITQTYDAAGQLLSTALAHSSTVLDGHTYAYDLNGNRTSVTRADNATVNYGYDNIGQLVSAVGMEPDGITPRGNENFGYGYDPAGNLLLRTNNTLLQTFTTDGANQLLNITRNNDLLTVAGSMTSSNAFTINGQGASIYHDLTFAVTNGVTIANGLNVLTAVAVSNSIPMTNKTVEFLPTTVNLANDANGNLISDGLHGYDYDCANQLTRITVTNILKAEFAYDGFGRKRIRREFAWQTNQWVETNEIHYVYDGMLVIQERASNNTPLVTYTRGVDLSGSMQGAGGIGGLLARTDANGNNAFYHADGNGNITMLVDNNGTVLAKYLYDSFGNTLGMWGTLASANSYRFSSKEYEPYTGLYYYGYRFYQPNLQRWLNRDPIGEAGGINLYQLVGNTPTSWIDTDGRGAIYPYGPNPPSQWDWSSIKNPFQNPSPPPPNDPNIPQLSQATPGGVPYTPPQQVANDGLVLGSDMNPSSPIAQNFSRDVQGPLYSSFLPLPGLKGPVKCPAAADGTAMRNVVQFQGMEVRAVRDLSHLDQGTLEAMQEVGFAPQTVNGEQIVLHHLDQNPAGPLVEMPRGNNDVWNTVQHPFGNTAGAGLTDAQRAAYNDWRTEYWQWRATQELNLRRVFGN